MRIIHLLLTTYLVFISFHEGTGGRGSSIRTKGFKNGKKSTSWRLKYLRRISEQLNPGLKLLSLKDINSKNYFTKDKLGQIVEDDTTVKHVPRIQCQQNEDSERLACPTPDRNGIFYCLDDKDLCDRTIHCPFGEDEDLTMCMFHKWANTLFRILVRGIKDLQNKFYRFEHEFKQFKLALE